MQSIKKIHIACIIGTRPEVIKMAPVYYLLQSCDWAHVTLINTAQHRELLDDMLAVFDISPDLDLNIMTYDQPLGQLTANLCSKIDIIVENQKFDAILAAGDTTTVFVASLIAFYHHIPFGHIEAGLRTYDKRQPFPEELNRVLTGVLATWHFAPTEDEKQNLIQEKISADAITVTGNTVIDALYWVLKNKEGNSHYTSFAKRLIIVTAHRRENFGEHLQNICKAILILSERFRDIDFVFPVHPNPHVQKIINTLLAGHARIHLLPPLKYDEFAHLMQQATLLLTDSGGIQEEAPALHKPVLVLRNTTERPAIITAGVGRLVGTDIETIVNAATELLTNEVVYNQMANGPSPYGDGHAAECIVETLYKAFY